MSTIYFVSLGCDKNLVDSEVMLGLLVKKGMTLTDDPSKADAIVVNTCCFINDAQEESVQSVLEMAEYKTAGSCKALVVTGCMAERYKEEIQQEIPEIDAVLGTNSYGRIVEAVEEAFARHSVTSWGNLSGIPEVDADRVLTTGGHFSYLKIAEGCGKHCTYCAIPKMRGAYRSVPMERLIKEAEYLASKGIKELILVAQETTLYGVDLYGEKKLPELLKKLCAVDGLKWIRILYCYPEEITEELIQVMKEEPKICHYLDMPIQHASDEILRRMGRKTSQADLRALIAHLREEIPDITLRTTLIAGFPGETEEDHEEMMQFIDEMEFDRLGCFTYSREEGTPAYDFPDQVPEEIKEERRDAVMELQQDISYDRSMDMVGRELEVMIEGQVAGENTYITRTYRDAPDVDGYLFFNSGEFFVTGDFVHVTVTGASEYDLLGELTNEPA